jgi:hypothetical protein
VDVPVGPSSNRDLFLKNHYRLFLWTEITHVHIINLFTGA